MLVGEFDVGVGLPGFVQGLEDGLLDRFVGALWEESVGGVWGEGMCKLVALRVRSRASAA